MLPVLAAGLSAQRQLYLYTNIQQYVADSSKLNNFQEALSDAFFCSG